MPPLSPVHAPTPAVALALYTAARRAGDPDDVAEAVAAAASRITQAVADGHSCAVLAAADAPLAHRLARSALVRRADDNSAAHAQPQDGAQFGPLHPLVLDGAAPGGRLYFARHFAREAAVAAGLCALVPPPPDADALARLHRRLAARFGDDPRQAGQKEAVRRAATHGLTLIAGGPGTGKTTTVAALLAVLRAEDAKLRIALAAPTGKAAARLAESLAGATSTDPIAGQPPATMTLHRLLGLRPQATLHPGERQPAPTPLPWDVIVVDEASMIDLALAAQLAARLPPDARLILLGDPDQLASVEAGAVFAELVAAAAATTRDTPLAGALARLTVSHRFDADASLGRLADAVRRGDAPAAGDILAAPDPTLNWPAAARLDLDALADLYAEYAAAFRTWAAPGNPRTDASAFAAFAAFGRSRILTALRQGPRGVGALNAALDARLAPLLTASALRPPAGSRYPGQPLMLTRNAPELGLYNGDTGLVVATDRGLAAAFPGVAHTANLSAAAGPAPLRTVPLHRLPATDTAWAITIHKSQGSEFDAVALVLPEATDNGAASPLLTRELLYTGLTRARRHVQLWASPDSLATAIERPTIRQSGLAARLQGIDRHASGHE